MDINVWLSGEEHLEMDKSVQQLKLKQYVKKKIVRSFDQEQTWRQNVFLSWLYKYWYNKTKLVLKLKETSLIYFKDNDHSMADLKGFLIDFLHGQSSIFSEELRRQNKQKKPRKQKQL